MTINVITISVPLIFKRPLVDGTQNSDNNPKVTKILQSFYKQKKPKKKLTVGILGAGCKKDSIPELNDVIKSNVVDQIVLFDIHEKVIKLAAKTLSKKNLKKPSLLYNGNINDVMWLSLASGDWESHLAPVSIPLQTRYGSIVNSGGIPETDPTLGNNVIVPFGAYVRRPWRKLMRIRNLDELRPQPGTLDVFITIRAATYAASIYNTMHPLFYWILSQLKTQGMLIIDKNKTYSKLKGGSKQQLIEMRTSKDVVYGGWKFQREYHDRLVALRKKNVQGKHSNIAKITLKSVLSESNVLKNNTDKELLVLNKVI